MEPCVGVHQAVVATGLFQLVYKTCGFRLGVLEEMVLVHVHVTDVNTSKVLLVVHIILKLSPQLEVVLILYVLVASTDVVLENVMDVTDVLHTLLVIT